MEEKDYIRKWLNGSLTPKEQQEFESSDDFQSIQRLTRALSAFKTPHYHIDEELSKIRNKKKDTGNNVRLRWMSPALKVAAIILVLFTVSYYLFETSQDGSPLVVLSESMNNQFLPDSSVIRLNAGSQLSYSEHGWTNNRLVELEGEGFFRVSSGSQFDVQTALGTVSVVGTAFNIAVRDEFFEVSCYEGRVQVTIKGREWFLPGSFRLRSIGGKITTGEVNLGTFPLWTKGESSFDSMPLKYVVEELARQYRVTIDSGNLDLDQLFTGSFAHNNVDLALRSITEPLNLNYQIKDAHIILRPNSK